jgi:hypothetical protein
LTTSNFPTPWLLSRRWSVPATTPPRRSGRGRRCLRLRELSLAGLGKTGQEAPHGLGRQPSRLLPLLPLLPRTRTRLSPKLSLTRQCQKLRRRKIPLRRRAPHRRSEPRGRGRESAHCESQTSQRRLTSAATFRVLAAQQSLWRERFHEPFEVIACPRLVL